MSQDLQNYIKQLRENGLSDKEMREELEKAGWSEEQINLYLAEITHTNTQGASGTKHQKTSKKRLLVIALLGVILLGGGAIFLASYSGLWNLQPIGDNENAPQRMVSNYGFSFDIPIGWHIWEGQSAAGDLMSKTDFADSVLNVMKDDKIDIAEDSKLKEYQEFMNDWNIENSEAIVLTQNTELDLTDRDLARAGKIAQTEIDSEKTLELKTLEITLHKADADIASRKKEETDTREVREITIGGKEALLVRSKQYQLVDWVFIIMPLNTGVQLSNGEPVKSVIFTKYTKKNDPDAVQEFINLVSELNLEVE